MTHRTHKTFGRWGLLGSALAVLVSACATPATAPAATPKMNTTTIPSTLSPTATTAQAEATGAGASPAPTATITAGKGGDVVAARNALAPAFVDGSNDFGFKLLNEMATADAGKNVFISPASVSLALAMVYNGAQGKTAEAMATVLGTAGLPLDKANLSYASLQTILRQADPQVTLDIANSLWVRQGLALNPNYLQRTQNFYQAQISEMDFSKANAADTINQWVSDNTRGKITQIVEPPIRPDVVLYLINAIYFKGAWQKKFNPAATQPIPFTPSNGVAFQTPMMFQTGTYTYLETSDFQAVRLPYGDGALSMVVMLPKPGKTLTQLRDQLSGSAWREWANQFKPVEGDIRLPKFKLEYKADLVQALSKLGMANAFGDGADFRGMRSDPPGLAISEVKHKTYVDVNEEGTEAAAVTSAGMRTTSMRVTEHFSMVVDHPFFVAIQDEQTNAILFSGLIEKPETPSA